MLSIWQYAFSSFYTVTVIGILLSLLSLSTAWVKLAGRDTKQAGYLSSSDHSASELRGKLPDLVTARDSDLCSTGATGCKDFVLCFLWTAIVHHCMHLNALTVVLKRKICYGCGVCSSNLQIDFSSLRMKHYYIKWENSLWLLLGKKQSKISVLLSLNFGPSLTCPDGFAQFPHFRCHLQQHCAVPHLSEQSLSHREHPAWNIWITITSTGFQHRNPKAESLGPLGDLVLYSSQKRVVSI